MDIYPYKYYSGNKKEIPCDFCEFKKICKHSKTKNKFRIIKNENKKEIKRYKKRKIAI